MNGPALLIALRLAAQEYEGKAVGDDGSQDEPYVEYASLEDSAGQLWMERPAPVDPAPPDDETLPENFAVALFSYHDPPDPNLLRYAGESRAVLAEAMKDEGDQRLQPLVEAVTKLTGARCTTNWSLAAVSCWGMTPAKLSEVLSKLPVRDFSVESRRSRVDFGYEGKQIKDNTLSTVLQENFYNGNVGNRLAPSTPIQIAIIEVDDTDSGFPNNSLVTHVGWLDTAGGSSRIARRRICDPTCRTFHSTAVSSATHGQIVAWSATGSIEQGQDSAWPGTDTDDQKKRSGMSAESEILYYRIPEVDGSVANAIEQAIVDGADIINMSFGDGSFCDVDKDSGGRNLAIRNAVQAGLMVFASAGNAGTAASCTINYPAVRPEVMAISGLETHWGGAYTGTELDDGSSRGSLTITVDGLSHSSTGPFLAAPFTISHYFNGSSGYRDWSQNFINGTSFSSPIAAGGAALVKDAFVDLGYASATEVGWTWMSLMALMGDRWSGPAASTRTNGTTSSLSGYGRLRLHVPDSDSLTTPWKFGYVWARLATINQGIKVGIGNIPAGATQLKVVTLWDEDDLEDAADITIQLEDGCSGTGPFPVLATDASYNLRKRVSTTAAAGKCVRLNVFPFHIPPGEERFAYVAWYYHGGSTFAN